MFGWHPLDKTFYYPTSKQYQDPADFGLVYESVWFETSDGIRLNGWFFPATRPAVGTVLHFHGNAGNVTGHFPQVAWLPAWGWNVLCFDYRGFGRSEGTVSRRGTILDGHAALDHLLERGDIDIDRIVSFGQSIGGAIATVVGAERRELRGFVLDAAFSGYRRIARYHIHRNPVLLVLAWWAPHLLIGGEYDALDYIGRLGPRPVLIFHGQSDHTVPWEMAVQLERAAKEPVELFLVPGMDHMEVAGEDWGAVRARILEFFERTIRDRVATPLRQGIDA